MAGILASSAATAARTSSLETAVWTAKK
jgi:hypothetical protein